MRKVQPIDTYMMNLMYKVVVVQDLNVYARVVLVETVGKKPSTIMSKREEQVNNFLAIMFNNRGQTTVPRTVDPLNQHYIILPTLDGPVQVDRKESIRLGLRQPHSDSEYGNYVNDDLKYSKIVELANSFIR